MDDSPARGMTLKRMLPDSACLEGNSDMGGTGGGGGGGPPTLAGRSLSPAELPHLSLSFVSSSSCAALPSRDAEDEPLRPGHHYSQGAAGGEPEPPVERVHRSGGVVRFALEKR